MDHRLTKAEWSSVTMECGERFVMMHGVVKMLDWCVDNWAILRLVRALCLYPTISSTISTIHACFQVLTPCTELLMVRELLPSLFGLTM